MKLLTVSLVVLLAVLHQDFWWWDDPTPVLGFLPIGLAWHIFISAAAGIAWWLMTKYCWPEHLQDFDATDGRAEEEQT